MQKGGRSHEPRDSPGPLRKRDFDAVPNKLSGGAIEEICPPPISTRRLRRQEDAPVAARNEIDMLMLAASLGNRLAVGAVAVAFGANLVMLARNEIERRTTAEEEAAATDLVSELLTFMDHGGLAYSPPEPGRALEWLEGIVGHVARGWDSVVYGDGVEDEQQPSDRLF